MQWESFLIYQGKNNEGDIKMKEKVKREGNWEPKCMLKNMLQCRATNGLV